MFKFDAKQYLNKITETPKENYQGLNQATIDSQWENNTQLYTIYEQKALPFVDEYDEYEALINTISDDLINTSKVYSDFVRILFRDIKHKQNYKGQYYKLNLDDEHEEYYICYDRMNYLNQTHDFKCVRCNNVLTWIDKYGKIITMPCYLGTDISSTNNLIAKDGIVPNTRMIILVQANDYTKNIIKNQRFMFQHSSVFKVEEVNNYMQEQGTNGEVTCIKIYVEYSVLLPSDNTELNLCDYYKTNYSLNIDQETISQPKGFVGSLTALLKNGNNEFVNMPLIWESSNSNIVTIDELGNYHIIGNNGENAIITCRMKDNLDIMDMVTINIIDNVIENKEIIVFPNNIAEMYENRKVEFKCAVYNNGEKLSNVVTCEIDGLDNDCYKLNETIEGYELTILKKMNSKINLIFKSEECDDVNIELKLRKAL